MNQLVRYKSDNCLFAAQQLAQYISTMAGLNFTCEADPLLPDFCLAIGQHTPTTAINKDEQFIIHGTSESLTISSGSTRGLLYGAYTFLEHLGCRWPRPGHDIVPKIKCHLNNIHIDDAPAFRWRGLCFDFAQVTTEMIDWMAKMRFNTLNVCWSCYREPHWPGNHIFTHAKQRGLICIMGGHCLEDLLDLEAIYEKHPEYFALLAGKRVDPRGKGFKGWRLCHSNPHAVKTVADILIDLFHRIPELDGISVWENDGYGNWCQCEKCKSLDPEIERLDPERNYPVRTERYLYYVQQLENHLNKLLPDKFLEFGAVYENAIAPLRLDVCPSNKQVFFHDGYEFCFRHGYDEPCNRERMEKSVEGWLPMFSQNSRAFSYNCDSIGHSEVPISLLTKIQNDAQSIRRCGLNGFHDLVTAAHIDELFDRWAINLHAMARYWWNPDLPRETFIDEFLDLYYGPAAQAMKPYHIWIEKETRKPGEGLYRSFDEDWRHDAGLHCRAQLSCDLDLIKKAYKFLDDAIKSTKNQTAIQKIQALRKNWQVMDLFFTGQEEPTKEKRKQIAEKLWEITDRTPDRKDPRHFGFITMHSQRWLNKIGQWDNSNDFKDDLIKIG